MFMGNRGDQNPMNCEDKKKMREHEQNEILWRFKMGKSNLFKGTCGVFGVRFLTWVLVKNIHHASYSWTFHKL